MSEIMSANLRGRLPDSRIVRSGGEAIAGRPIVWLAQSVVARHFWQSLVRALATEFEMHPLLIAFTAEDAKAYAAQIPSNVPVTIIQMYDYYGFIVSGGSKDLTDADLDREIASRERLHGLSILRGVALSDRHLGRDLMTGAGGFAKSKISERRSHRTIAEATLLSFRFWEQLAERFPPRLVLTYAGGAGLPGRPMLCVCRQLGVTFRNMSFSRFGDHFYWADDEFGYTPRFLSHHAATPPATEAQIAEVSVGVGAPIIASAEFLAESRQTRFQWAGVLRQMAETTARHAHGYLRGYAKFRHGYLLSSVLAQIVRARRHLDWLDRNAERSLAKVEHRRIIYHALQVEPELTTTLFGEFASDQLSLVREMALSLPADATLLVKEHPWQVGMRDLDFYRRIMKLPNTLLIHPFHPSIDLIQRSVAVSSGSSTVTYEAAALGIPAFHVQQRSLLDVVSHAVAMRRRDDVERVRTYLFEDDANAASQRVRDGARFYRAMTTFGFRLGPEGVINRKAELDRDVLAAVLNDLDVSLPGGFAGVRSNGIAA